jgi:hypothetical protein
MITVQQTCKNTLNSFRRPSQNTSTYAVWTVLYWTRSRRTQFGVSINVWRLAGYTLIITCNFLYCNHQVHRYTLIILYMYTYTTKYYPTIEYHLLQFLPMRFVNQPKVTVMALFLKRLYAYDLGIMLLLGVNLKNLSVAKNFQQVSLINDIFSNVHYPN